MSSKALLPNVPSPASTTACFMDISPRPSIFLCPNIHKAHRRETVQHTRHIAFQSLWLLSRRPNRPPGMSRSQNNRISVPVRPASALLGERCQTQSRIYNPGKYPLDGSPPALWKNGQHWRRRTHRPQGLISILKLTLIFETFYHIYSWPG